MIDFLQALLDPQVAFLRYAVLVGLLASVAFGITGTYVVTRRISYLAAAIAHCVLGGVGLAVYLHYLYGLWWLSPLLGAAVAAVVSALLIGWVSLVAQQREDTAIGAVWSVGMALGLIFLQQVPGYLADPMSYLFGDILLVGPADLSTVLILDLVVLGLVALWHPKLTAVCFDEEFAAVRGLPVKRYYLALLCLTALAIVLLIRLVGMILVIALMTLPAATAGQFARRLVPMMCWATGVCMVCVLAGIAFSYIWGLRTGPVIVLIAALFYAMAAAIGRWRSNTLRRLYSP
ncbi:MAG: metal ABC transporter permease [Thermoguttaceae bacterium]|nr:metal ABC transporter permease [Thermoguttaceae bacterium]MDW8038461.1 metal ABC transporter permease [Thermoguttaceae bacterium]